jgi:hypothetical protein
MYKLLLVTLAVFAVANAENLVGGWTDAPTTDKVLSLANSVMSFLPQFTGFVWPHSLISVRNVQTQVVAGIKTRFNADVFATYENCHYVR